MAISDSRNAVNFRFWGLGGGGVTAVKELSNWSLTAVTLPPQNRRWTAEAEAKLCYPEISVPRNFHAQHRFDTSLSNCLTPHFQEFGIFQIPTGHVVEIVGRLQKM